jgi:hypothetical protein
MQNRALKVILAIFVLANVLTVPIANAEAQSYYVGDKGPSGGTIAYVDEYDKFSWDYIEAAPANWMGEKSAESIRWSPFGSNATSLTGLGSAIGDGAANTTKILNTFGTGWVIKSAVRDVNNCSTIDGKKFCNVTITLDTNHGVTRFDTSQYPVMLIFCEGIYLDSILGSLTGEIKVVDAKSFSFVEQGSALKLADQINSKINCKISYAAEFASSARIGGNADWVLPSYEELEQVQRAVGTNNQSPYVIDQSILKKNGYTGGYYSTSSLRDAGSQRVWGFTNMSTAGKGGALNLIYGAPVIPIRYFKTSVPVRNKDIIGEENAKPGPTEINGQILQTDTNWYAKSGPYKVRGSIQIPANVTLKIHPGAVVDFTEANVTLLGKIVIGSNASPLITKVSLGNEFVAKGDGGQITIENSEIIGSNGALNSYGTGLKVLSIDNSTISKFRQLADRFFTKVSINDSVLKDIAAITTDFSYVYDFSITKNVIYEMRNLFAPYPCGDCSGGNYQSDPVSIISGNLFLNTVNSLNLVVPNITIARLVTVFENNRFESPKFLTVSGGLKAGGNYWNATDEANLRTLAKVNDGKSDITLPIISFAPFLTNPPATPTKYPVLLDLLTREKKAATEKETSDKLLSNVKCSITDTGMRYESSFASNSTDSVLKEAAFNWHYALLKSGANPGARENYGAIQLIRSTPTPILDITYEDLLKLAGGVTTETILIVSGPSVTVNSSVITNTLGRGCYIGLPSVLVAKQAADKIVADKLAAERAAADKAVADKIASEKAAADKLAASKNVTITCVKGKLTKKVTAVKPVCPKGYKKK